MFFAIDKQPLLPMLIGGGVSLELVVFLIFI